VFEEDLARRQACSRPLAKIGDVGLSRFIAETSNGGTMTQGVGTTFYLVGCLRDCCSRCGRFQGDWLDPCAAQAPEVLSLRHKYGVKADLFSFSVSMCELVVTSTLGVVMRVHERSDVVGIVTQACQHLDAWAPGLSSVLQACFNEDPVARSSASDAEPYFSVQSGLNNDNVICFSCPVAM
jgi:hypothetical protein